ncbi:MAG: ParB/RepB/Spo0J family partition protein [Chloroflexi bacterium]|nr:ParB/RepB/Spo0J family partition protein [Chloroflexota bacterium]
MSTPKGGLGKGLGALIPLATPTVTEVNVQHIGPNPHQPRQITTKQDLEELAASLRQHGLLQPLVVTQTSGETGEVRYQLIAGERRWLAAQLAGLTKVPVIIKEATPQESLQMALVENIQRADLNPLEEAAAYYQLSEEFGLTQEEIATKVGKKRTSVANTLRLLHLPIEAKEAILAERISEGHARALLGLTDPEQQRLVLRLIEEKGLSVRQTEELVRRLTRGGGRRTTVRPPETLALEDELRRALGTKVSLFRSRKGGKLVIHFYSEEELQSIYERLVDDPSRNR